jgi:hypothetical protein
MGKARAMSRPKKGVRGYKGMGKRMGVTIQQGKPLAIKVP